MKGIILAAGKGTRLYPASSSTSKILLPIYDKPAIYYPLSVLINVGIKDIMIITSKNDRASFKKLLGDGSQFGVSFRFAVQKVQRGIADALIIAEKFIKDDSVMLALGDNIFAGAEMQDLLAEAVGSGGATVFCTPVDRPQDFGVAEMDGEGKVVSLEEKPQEPKSNLAVTGLYYYDSNAAAIAKEVQPSKRGELEITDVNRIYMERGQLHAVQMPDSIYWADTGTPDSMLAAAEKIKELQESGELVGSPEATALRMGLISNKQLLKWIDTVGSTSSAYFTRLRNLARE